MKEELTPLRSVSAAAAAAAVCVCCVQDVKMKKMASMQVYMATDPASRQAVDRQMITWDENLEKLHIEQYQLRCYLSALQAADLPSTKAR